MLSIVNGFLNLVIKGINWLTAQMNKIHFDVPDWVPLVGGKSVGFNIQPIPENAWNIPYLASGAVIPPNREFLAVLGDQKTGTNVEAPLETIVDAFRSVQGTQNVTIEFTGSLAQLARVLAPHIKTENKRIGGSLVNYGGGR